MTASKKTSKIKGLDDIQVKKTMFGGNISVSPNDFKKLTDLAKKQIAAEIKKKELNAKIATLKTGKQLAEICEGETDYCFIAKESANGRISIRRFLTLSKVLI